MTLDESKNLARWDAAVGLDSAAALLRDQLPLTLARSLPADETVLLVTRPSGWFLLLARADALFAIGVVIAIGALLGWYEVWGVRASNVMAYGAIALSVMIVWNCLDFATRAYVLTDRRALRLSGVIRRTTIEIPLNRIQSVVLHKGVRERLCDAGTLLISSAAVGGGSFSKASGVGTAAGGASGGEFTWFFIDRPERASAMVREAIERYARA